MLRKVTFLFFVPMVVSLIVSVPAFAQKQTEGGLEGLTTIYVRTHLKMDGGDKASGVTPEQLQSDAESLLGDAGLKVVQQEEFKRHLQARSYPLALFDLEGRVTKPSGMDFYIYNFNFKVRQATFLARKPTVKFLATTWETIDFGVTENLASMRDRVKQAVNLFIQDYKAENPK